MGCIGMGQAPAVGRNSLRTMPRNFPGRSGTDEDAVWLCSPDPPRPQRSPGRSRIRATSTWRIRDPRLPDTYSVNTRMLLPPLGEREARDVELVKGENVKSLPEFDPLPDDMELPVMLTVGDDVSTDEIMPAGSRVLPFRSNIPKMAEFVYLQVDDTYPTRAAESDGGHAIVGGDNYGQGSSREHAVIAPRYLGLRVVVAKSFARIHWQNLANFGVLPLEFEDPADADRISRDDVLRFTGLRAALESSTRVPAQVNGEEIALTHRLSARQVSMVLAGGRIAHRAGEDPTIEAKPAQPEG